MSFFRAVKHRLRAYFVTGLLVLVPLLLTFFLLKAVVGALDRILGDLPARYVGREIPGLGVVVVLLVIPLVGMVSRNFVARRLGTWGEAILARIPVVRPIYRGAREVVGAILGANPRQFSQVVLVEYPLAGSWAIAFVTGEARGRIAAPLTEPCVTVFLPTTPNPTSGFLLVVPVSHTRPVELTVEDAMKVVISGGLVMPGVVADMNQQLPTEKVDSR
ncbi:MAG TPA: DUF502 domain-containing protein [bacterium]|jgi:uncharacterized membrane protein